MSAGKIIAVVVLVACVAFFIMQWQADQYAEFMQDAARTKGNIISLHDEIRDQKNRRKDHWVRYHYQTPDGKEYETDEVLEYDDLWQHMHEGQAVDVYYSRKKPHYSFLAEAMDRRLGKGVSKQQ